LDWVGLILLDPNPTQPDHYSPLLVRLQPRSWNSTFNYLWIVSF